MKWKIARVGTSVIGESGHVVAHCFGRTDEERKTSTRLIAAAPELLDTLEALLCEVAPGVYALNNQPKLVADAVNLIDRIKGKKPDAAN